MDTWVNIAENKIRKAMEEGAFDDLEGKGKPLDLTENPYEDPSLRMGHRLVKNNGFAPLWIEERKDIESELARLRKNLARAFDQCPRQADARAEERWQRALAEFRREVKALNQRILSHNLRCPEPARRLPVNAGFEIDRYAVYRALAP